ncbi:hypothetical protein TSUD_283520 [Trifolium subterraneum]|uniref:DUF223 domain-containing protein n=1 Tax=Trifolium subterraneum TaxID=3900 RepID=A0A2Z6PDQ1_TRISU|nr:hypothetical protein TSUD_283520 [Trifolium subterraneum]
MFAKMVHKEKGSVDDIYGKVADRVPGKENVRIKVSVLRLWKVPAFLNLSEYSSIEMVLFGEKIEEGKVYEMSYFSIFPMSGNYDTTLHPYKLVFQVKTSVSPSESCGITQFGISVTTLGEICDFNHDYEYLVLDKEAFEKQMLEKLIWICSVMLVGARHGGFPVGVVEKESHSEVNLLILSITICLIERKYYNIQYYHV